MSGSDSAPVQVADSLFTYSAALLLGDRWQRPLARMLDVDDRLVRRWAAGERPVPGWVWQRLTNEFGQLSHDVAAALVVIEDTMGYKAEIGEDGMPRIEHGEPILRSSGRLPPLGPDGISDWVWVDIPPTGGMMARYHSGKTPWWEEKESGHHYGPNRVKLWAFLAGGRLRQ